MDAQTYISPDLADFITKYRTDPEMVSCEQSMIADSMCGIENTISGMHVDERTEQLLRRAATTISTYHWILELIRKGK